MHASGLVVQRNYNAIFSRHNFWIEMLPGVDALRTLVARELGLHEKRRQVLHRVGGHGLLGGRPIRDGELAAHSGPASMQRARLIVRMSDR